MKQFDVVIVGAGPAGIGVTAMLKELDVKRMMVIEREEVGATFDKWPKEMKLITPSFTTNFYGHLDLNAVISGTSPAYSIRKEHPTGKEYAQYLRDITDYFELPVLESTDVKEIIYSDGSFKIHVSNGGPIASRYLIWAAGEFQYPNTNSIPGAELCLHNSLVKSWEQIEGDDIYIIGGYESGIDAAVHLSRLGKKVHVLDRKVRWKEYTTDPSANLSPYTLERLNQEIPHGRIELIGNVKIKAITKQNDQYVIDIKERSNSYTSATQPILATGFKSSLTLVDDLFDWEEKESYALLTDQDESTKTPGLFLVGPQVRHENLIFCFIYKYRQRFGVVANAIGERLGLDTTKLEPYRDEGLYLDDLSCCGEECAC